MANIDTTETDKFAAMAAHWWDPNGPCRPLHELNPVRLQYVHDFATLSGANVLDAGCGGGILTESLAASRAHVEGLDVDRHVISTAKLHALEHELSINYYCEPIETFSANRNGKYNVITCMEMLEHVPDPSSIVAHCAQLLAPGGLVFFSTLNRTAKSYLQAIIGAEYILNMLPKGTHDYQKFIKPHELNRTAMKHSLKLIDIRGIHYNPLLKEFSLTDSVDVNYICVFRKQNENEH